MKPRKPNEPDAAYIGRLESQNASLKADNDRLSKWLSSTGESVMRLSTDGSVAFQAMAEWAGVRSHPSVTKMVELFDKISHPQWPSDPPPKFDLPQDWNCEVADTWAGDADMSMNSPIAEAMEMLRGLSWSSKVPQSLWEPMADILAKLQEATQRGVQGAKNRAGFKPKTLGPFPQKHYRNMSADELRDLIGGMGWMALDLSQDMDFANQILRRDLRASAYRRICGDLSSLANFALQPPPGKIDIKIVGGDQEAF